MSQAGSYNSGNTPPIQDLEYVSAYLTADTAGVTGDGTNVVVRCNATISTPTLTGYNTATGTFTAPENGIYSVSSAWTLRGLDVTNTSMNVVFGFAGTGPDVGNGGYATYALNPVAIMTGGFLRGSASATFVMNAGDVVNLQIQVNNGATKNVMISIGVGVPPGFSPGGTWFKIVKIG